MWKDEVHDPMEVSSNLLCKIMEVYDKCITLDDGGDHNVIDVATALKSTEMKSYLNSVCEL